MRTLASLFIFITVALTPLRADEFTSWEWLVPKPVGDHLHALAFDGTRFIGVGGMGVVLTSTNGTNWHLTYNETTNRMWGITVGVPRTVAYGDLGTALVTDNGEDWVAANLASTGRIGFVVYGGGRYVAGDHLQNGFLSTDGLNWNKLAETPEYFFSDVVYGNGLFVGVSGGAIATSSDGLSWVRRETVEEGVLRSIAYGDGVFVAVGSENGQGIILTSYDGIDWVLQTTDGPLSNVAFGPFGFVITGGELPFGEGTSLVSEDGLYFSSSAPGGSGLASVPAGLACGNGICVGVSSPGQIWTTTDGTNWVSQSSGQELTVTSLATDGSTLVGVGGKGTLVSSTDGVNFESHIVSTNENYFKVIHAGGRFVTIGSRGVVRTSANGRDWPLEDTGSTATLKDVAHGNGRTVAIGWNATGKAYGQFLVREAAGTWQTVWPAQNDFINVRIAFGNGRFVAAAYYGEVWTSTDGLVWQKLNVGVNQTILPIQFINDRFVGFTSNAIGQSYDGLNWYFTPGTPPAMQQIAHGNGLYVAAGWNWGGIEVSEDLVHWSVRPMKTMDLTSVVYFRDAFYVSGFVLKSASSLVPEIVEHHLTAGNLNFNLFGKIGREYELQSSTNLTDWEPEQDYTQSARQHPLTLPTGPDQRFYRVKLKEP